MRVAILYICTGKYNQFFEGFYRSCEKYFMPGVDKEYFVFTDDMELCNSENVHLYYKVCEGFPKDSLFKFRMFLSIESELRDFDWMMYLNSNAEFRSVVTPEEYLPQDGNELFGAVWPGKTRPIHHPMFFPYERNKESHAYIAPGDKEYLYYMGGANGGTARAYLEMIRILANNIEEDYAKGIIACFHDESHINKYFHQHKPYVLSAPYCWPEEWSSDFAPKMVFRDKVRLDKYFDKGRKHSLFAKAYKLGKLLSKGVKWYL